MESRPTVSILGVKSSTCLYSKPVSWVFVLFGFVVVELCPRFSWYCSQFFRQRGAVCCFSGMCRGPHGGLGGGDVHADPAFHGVPLSQHMQIALCVVRNSAGHRVVGLGYSSVSLAFRFGRRAQTAKKPE